MNLRKVGVEEELMLVDPGSGALMAVSHRALHAHRAQLDAEGSGHDVGTDGGLEQELFLQQIETGTSPHESIGDLERDIVACRRRAAESAEAVQASLIATGTPVLADTSAQRVTPEDRYERIVGEFGEIGRQAAVCGMHVHVDVGGDDEGVRVLDGVRPWLPVLRALSVNSPFWQGVDSGYASWRSQVWGRWPSAGPSEPYGDVASYQRNAESMIASGASLDRAMLYFDARLSESYPTVEIRVFDATTEIDDVGLVAALSRALVDTVVAGGGTPIWRSDLLRAAHWRASRYGLGDRLLDPLSQELASARSVVEHTITYARDALDAHGDTDRVVEAFERLLARGTGATRQRAVADAGGGVEAVVHDLRERFTASWRGV
ncbi:MAG: glutamate--cysteine ligase [Nocardioidaceae bacterium]|nr:glutamate--cysteine ligase [Nocardioidaceae bacterium]